MLDTFINIGGTDAIGTDATTNAQLAVGIVRNGLILLFVAMIILAILYAITSGIKFMRAQGDSGEIEEATESIKYVVIGVGFAFVGIILVILIGNIFTPASSVTLSLRCFFGDLYMCKVSTVALGENCPKGFTKQATCKNLSLNICKPQGAKETVQCSDL